MPTTTDVASPALSRLHDRLTQETRALVYFDRGQRALYSTDASLYQIEPVGVVVPRTVEDVIATVRIAAQEKVAIVPRGAATSLSGQTIGAAIIIDFSKYLNRIGVVDRDAMTVRVEPGVVLDQLNAHLKPLGLMFGPDVSTSDRATIGGMIGNNSAGARSLRYGKTVDHVRAVEVVLADGTAAGLGPVSDQELSAICQEAGSVGRVHRAVRDTVAAHRQAIIDHFPHILRRVSGYNLDEFVPGLPVRPVGWAPEPWRFNLARLIVGSEGSLAVVTAAELKVVPVPPAQGLVVLSFATIPAALERLADIVATGPVAVEMLDRMILDLAAENPLYSHYLNFADGRPAAVLAAQFYADSQDELAARADDLARRFESRPGVLGIRKSLTTLPRTISGRSARPGSRCSWPWLAMPSRSRSWKTRPSAPTVYLGFTTVFKPSSSGMASARRATGTPMSAVCTSGRLSTSRQPKGWRRCGRSLGKSLTWWSSSAVR